jgi:hypothetical protein
MVDGRQVSTLRVIERNEPVYVYDMDCHGVEAAALALLDPDHDAWQLYDYPHIDRWVDTWGALACNGLHATVAVWLSYQAVVYVETASYINDGVLSGMVARAIRLANAPCVHLTIGMRRQDAIQRLCTHVDSVTAEEILQLVALWWAQRDTLYRLSRSVATDSETVTAETFIIYAIEDMLFFASENICVVVHEEATDA